MHKVQRAIIMAAGIGQRLQPVTLHTPKPLVKVGGVRMIDTVIQSLRRNGISEIYVVVGHLRERFVSLEREYPGLRLIDNPWYDSCNNIASLYVAREHLSDVIILDGDQIVYDDTSLTPLFERSGYNAVWTDAETNEWLLQLDGQGVVCHCSRSGGAKGWQLFSISRWTAEDGAKLRELLEYEFEEKENRQIYWDDVAIFCHPQEFRLGIQPMKAGAVVEIDSFEELLVLDPSYKGEDL